MPVYGAPGHSRFLRHILPRGFRKIRSYGILAGKNRTEKIAAARALLGPAELPDPAEGDADASDEDPNLCPKCGVGTMQTIAPVPRRPRPKVVFKWIYKPNHNAA